MNIEQLIEENTAALARLTAAVENMCRVIAKAETAVAVADGAPRMTATEVLARQEPPAKKQSGKSSSGTAKEPPASSAPSASGGDTAEGAVPMGYADLQAPGLALYKSNRDALVAILKHYGVAKLDMVPQDKWPEAKAKIEAALA